MNPLAFVKTAFNSNLSTVAVSEADQAALSAKGIAQPTLQRYVVWRRATVLMVVVATLLSAGVSTYETYTDDEDEAGVIETVTAGFMAKLQEAVPAAAGFVKEATPDEEDAAGEEPTKLVGTIIDDIHLASLYALPAAALLALFLGNRLRASYRVLVAGFLFSFFMPIILALCPWSWWGYVEPVLSPGADPGKFILNEAEGLLEGVSTVALLLPAVLSLVPGVVKGCLRVKSLVPQSLLPGWLIVMAAPLYGLFLLAIFVALDQFIGQPFILAGFGLVTASSLVYALWPGAFTRPLLEPEDYRRMKRVQMVVGLLTAAGGLLLLGYIVTREFMGVHLLGTDPKTALMRPIEVVQYLLEIISRSMFVTALSADLFLRANLTSWKQQRALAASPAAAEYDSAMEAMDGAIEPKAA